MTGVQTCALPILRLRSSASAYFNRTLSSGSTTAWTWSGWVKRGYLGSNQTTLFFGDSTTTNYGGLYFTSDNLYLDNRPSAGLNARLTTTQVFRDPSAWYHIVAVWDTANATSGDRLRLYVNGTRITAFSTATYPAQNTASVVNTAIAHEQGATNAASSGVGNFFDGYLTEINFIDGQALTPSSFGQTNSITGVWQPIKYSGTYGTNGFYLNFSDNSSNTATTIGKDYSGNGNNWTPNNISVTAGATYDSMLDVPTPYADGGNGRGNYCVLNPLDFNSGTVSNGNLQWSTSTAVGNGCFGSFAFDIADSTNKYYWEMTITSGDGVFGIVPLTTLPSNTARTGSYSYYTNGNKYSGTSASAYGASFTTGDVIGVAVGAGIITFYKNGTSQGSAFTGLTGFFKPAIWEVSGTFVANFGQRPFSYTPPSGFNALNTFNLPTPTIANGGQNMNAVLWTGNTTTLGVTQAITGLGFQPDFVWAKTRNQTFGHYLYDALRGVGASGSLLQSNSTNAQATNGEMNSFDSNGFTVKYVDTLVLNWSSSNNVGWAWKAGNSSSSNTSGSITSTVSVNATAGFSVLTATTPASYTNYTAGHGLGVTPAMIIYKERSGTANWWVWHKSFATPSNALQLNTTVALQAGTYFGTQTSTVASFASGMQTGLSVGFVAYCWAEVAGYSAFGSYTGNGSTDGPFIYTGFRPRWVMVKRTDTGGYAWVVIDTSRSPYNQVALSLYPNYSNAEATSDVYDILSNGFKLRTTDPANNASGGTYIYAAFSESAFKYSLGR